MLSHTHAQAHKRTDTHICIFRGRANQAALSEVLGQSKHTISRNSANKFHHKQIQLASNGLPPKVNSYPMSFENYFQISTSKLGKPCISSIKRTSNSWSFRNKTPFFLQLPKLEHCQSINTKTINHKPQRLDKPFLVLKN